MKPRNREINIFNMSLLDILCGALGTFCFLMLVLFPYYSVGKSAKQAPDIPPGVDPKTLEEAKARIKELEETLKKFQGFAQDLQNQVTQLQAENQKLKEQAKSLGTYASQMEMRNPLAVDLNVLQSGGDDVLQIYVEDDRKNDQGRATPRVDPSQIQPSYWPGDMSGYGIHGAYFIIRDTPAGKYRIVLKVVKHDPASGPLVAQGSIQTVDKFDTIPRLWVTQAQALVDVALVNVTYDKDKGYKQDYQITVPKELQQAPAGTK